MHPMLLMMTMLVGEAKVTPPPAAEARLLMCGPWPKQEVSSFIWELVDDQPVITQRVGSFVLSMPSPGEHPRKPPSGCFAGLPRPSVDWHLTVVERWARQADGTWVDSKHRAATVDCTRATVRAVRDATQLVPKPDKGCGDDDQLVLVGGPRVTVEVTRCTLKTAGQTYTLNFGVERISSEWDCTAGGDWRITTP